MPVFRYEAIDPGGRRLRGELEASTEASVVAELRSHGRLPVRVAAAPPRAGRRGSWRPSWRRPLGARELALLTRQLAVLLQARLTLDEAFSLLSRRSRGPAGKAWIARLQAGVRSGLSLAQALERERGIVSPTYLGLVRTGEASGALAEILGQLAGHLELIQSRRQKLVSALVYPVVLLLMCLVAIGVLTVVVLPRFRPFLQGAGVELPWLLKGLTALGDLVAENPWLPLLATLALAAGLRLSRRSRALTRFGARLVLGLPGVGRPLIEAMTARLARTVGLMLEHGVQLPAALAIASDAVDNDVLRAALGGIEERVRQGAELSASLAEACLFPDVAAELVAVGERSGRLAAMLTKLADLLDQQVEETVARRAAMLVPLLTILCGGMVAAVVGTLFATLLDVYAVPLGGSTG